MSREECLAHRLEAQSRGDYQKAARVILDGYRGDLLTVDELKSWVPDTWLFLNPPTCPYGPLTASPKFPLLERATPHLPACLGPVGAPP